MKDFIPIPNSYAHSFYSLRHMHFFHFGDTCYLGSNGSFKFLEFIVVFYSILEGRSSTGSRMLSTKELKIYL